MKKIYLLIAASAVVLSATAGDFSSERSFTRGNVSVSKVAPAANYSFVERQHNENALFVKQIRKADSNPSIEGTWTLTFGDYYFEDSVNGYLTAEYTATLNRGILFFDTKEEGFYPFYAKYDESDNTLTFVKEYLGKEDKYFMYQIPYIYDWDTNEPVFVDSFDGEYVPEQSIIAFEYDAGLGWRAFHNEEGTVAGDFFAIFDFVVASSFDTSSSLQGNWKDMGKARFCDGWVLPGLGINQLENVYEVPLQQNSENENLYRLVNPYKYGPAAEYNEATGDGYIVFDVSDPEHVVFKPAESGYVNPMQGISAFYCYNQLGMLAISYPEYTVNQIIELQQGYTPWTTFKDDVVTLTSIVNNSGNQIYDANWGYQNAPLGGYYWQTQGGQKVNMDAYIFFPGYNAVETIGVDENAPVEYFNLQGVRVLNPEAGQIVIKRQGSTAVKELVK